jgi:hypothetical protein
MPLTRRQQSHLEAAQRKLRTLGHRDPETFAIAKSVANSRRGDYQTVEKIHFELLGLVRAELARDHVHVGYTVLELAVFNAIRDGSTDPVADIVVDVRTQHLHEPGLLIYPLFGLGLFAPQNTSLLDLPSTREVIDPDAGFAVTSQVASVEGLRAFLDRAISGLGIVGSTPVGALQHHLSMPVLGWLLENPIIVVRVRSLTMGAGENQPAYIRLLRHRTAMVAMASVLTPPRGGPFAAASSNIVNNHETLDFKHYLVFETAGDASRPLRSDRVPMGPRRASLVQLADLRVDIDPEAWQLPAFSGTIGEITDAMVDLEDLQAEVEGGSSRAELKANLARKLSTSLHWYRRSFASFADPREAAVGLAVAFEALLSDGFTMGITKIIMARATACLDQRQAPSALSASVGQLFDWRGAIVHKGEPDSEPSLRDAQRAYIDCFIEVVRRVQMAAPTKTLQIEDLFERKPMSRWDRLRARLRAIFTGRR